jgi:hypothetical protein
MTVASERRGVLAKGQTPSAFLDLQYRVLDRVVLSKLREPLGGNLKISPVGTSETEYPLVAVSVGDTRVLPTFILRVFHRHFPYSMPPKQ